MWKIGARYQYRVAPNKCDSKIKKKKRALSTEEETLEFG